MMNTSQRSVSGNFRHRQRNPYLMSNIHKLMLVVMLFGLATAMEEPTKGDYFKIKQDHPDKGDKKSTFARVKEGDIAKFEHKTKTGKFGEFELLSQTTYESLLKCKTCGKKPKDVRGRKEGNDCKKTTNCMGKYTKDKIFVKLSYKDYIGEKVKESTVKDKINANLEKKDARKQAAREKARERLTVTTTEKKRQEDKEKARETRRGEVDTEIENSEFLPFGWKEATVKADRYILVGKRGEKKRVNTPQYPKGTCVYYKKSNPEGTITNVKPGYRDHEAEARSTRKKDAEKISNYGEKKSFKVKGNITGNIRGKARRRLTNQRLIDRFIRESERILRL